MMTAGSTWIFWYSFGTLNDDGDHTTKKLTSTTKRPWMRARDWTRADDELRRLPLLLARRRRRRWWNNRNTIDRRRRRKHKIVFYYIYNNGCFDGNRMFARRKCCLFNFFFKIPRNRRFFIEYRVDLVKIGGDVFSIARSVAMAESCARVSPSATSARRRR